MDRFSDKLSTLNERIREHKIGRDFVMIGAIIVTSVTLMADISFKVQVKTTRPSHVC